MTEASVVTSGKKVRQEVTRFLRAYTKQHHVKVVALGICGGDEKRNAKLATRLWLKYDIVAHLFPAEKPGKKEAATAAQAVAKRYHDGSIARVSLTHTRQVIPSYLTNLDEYAAVTSPRDFSGLMERTRRYREKHIKMVFFSSTPSGGGVALMRHAMMRLYRLLGVDVSWYVMSPDTAVFDVTKRKFHNVLQGVAARNVILNSSDKKIYEDWVAKNARAFRRVYRDADVVVIDDPQPSGMIPFIKQANPQVKIIYRSHIQVRADLINRQGLPQEKTWSFLKKNIYQADIFVSHPIKAFVPKDLPKGKVVLMPAATDPLDGLNKELSPQHLRYYQRLFNQILAENGQSPLRLSRPYIIQVARFDPSKGIPDVVEAYRRFRKEFDDTHHSLRETPQLVIIGNGAIDDPQGSMILDEILLLLEMDRYKHLASDIKVARVPHVDQLLNALLRGSSVALQLSRREGFEVKVTESLAKGVPVVAYRTGGIPLQIQHEKNGFLVTTGDTKKVAQYLFDLFTDKKLYEKMSRAAAQTKHPEYWTVVNATKWLFLATELFLYGKVSGAYRRSK